jgi:hypothetical protein
MFGFAAVCGIILGVWTGRDLRKELEKHRPLLEQLKSNSELAQADSEDRPGA